MDKLDSQLRRDLIEARYGYNTNGVRVDLGKIEKLEGAAKTYALAWHKQEVERIIGEDSPLEPTPDAIGDPTIDPKKWREWSIVENALRAKQRKELNNG